MQGVREKSAFILTGNRAHLLQLFKRIFVRKQILKGFKN
jgi:hypothetical protein